jgi:hypothetical protein
MRAGDAPSAPWKAIPPEVIEWARAVFAGCNQRTTETLSMSPNTSEATLDQTWIAHLASYSVPRVVGSGWVVRIDAHFLGGGRHFGSWEVADIGILVLLRDPSGVRSRKVALLQSKRLYPVSGTVREETLSDYVIGFARLDDPEDELISLGVRRTFTFNHKSRYKMLVRDGSQHRAIDGYQKDPGLKVYYHLYNPWQVPFRQRVPIAEYVSREGLPELGVRVIPATLMHGVLHGTKSPEPSLGDLSSLSTVPDFGWRLETFVADEVLACREGDSIPDRDDVRLRRLFGDRTGPIAAGIAITIEAPELGQG